MLNYLERIILAIRINNIQKIICIFLQYFSYINIDIYNDFAYNISAKRNLCTGYEGICPVSGWT